jgi:hypothetical protein
MSLMPGPSNSAAMRTIRSAVISFTLVLAACSIQRPGGGPPPKQLRDVLTRSEIMSSTATELDLYQAIRSLRPNFLSAPPGVRSPASRASMATVVFVDRVRQAGIETLHALPASSVEEVRYLDPTASQSEFGPSVSGGALLVKMYKPPKDSLSLLL